MITVKNLSKSFENDTPLSGVNFSVKTGEFIALVGPSGSGKSSLLHLIAGLSKPTSGEIKTKSKEIGFIFQEFHLETFLTVSENIKLPTYFHQGPHESVEGLLAEIDLSEKANSKISDLSGGQKQRIAIARALITKPKIILADEPTGNLDAKTGMRIIKLLKKLHTIHKTTLIIATHDPEIAKVADRIITIKNKQCS